MAAEDNNKALIRRWVDGVSQGDATVSAEVVGPDYRMNGQALGPQGAQQVSTLLLSAFPDWHGTLDDLIGEGDQVAARITYRGTHQGVWHGRGPLQGIPPTGRQFAITSLEWYRIADGKVAEAWVQVDFPAWAQQLGVSTGPT